MIDERDMFKKALAEAMYQKYDCELAKANNGIDISCSKRHYLRLSAILGFNVGNAKRFSKRLLAAILAAALLLTGCTVYAYRTEIKEFFVEIYEKHIRVTYDTDKNNLMGKNIEKVYRATYIPEGYELVKNKNTHLYVYYEWQNSNGDIIALQQKAFDGMRLYVDAEDGSTEIINCGKYKIYFRVFQNLYYYIWDDGNYVFTLESNVEVLDTEIFKIIDGIKCMG